MQATPEAVFACAMLEAWLQTVSRKEALRYLGTLDKVLGDKGSRPSVVSLFEGWPEAVAGAQLMAQSTMKLYVRRAG